jgi:hypothetical protein
MRNDGEKVRGNGEDTQRYYIYIITGVNRKKYIVLKASSPCPLVLLVKVG